MHGTAAVFPDGDGALEDGLVCSGKTHAADKDLRVKIKISSYRKIETAAFFDFSCSAEDCYGRQMLCHWATSTITKMT